MIVGLNIPNKMYVEDGVLWIEHKPNVFYGFGGFHLWAPYFDKPNHFLQRVRLTLGLDLYA